MIQTNTNPRRTRTKQNPRTILQAISDPHDPLDDLPAVFYQGSCIQLIHLDEEDI